MYPTRRMRYLPPLYRSGEPVFHIDYLGSAPKLTDDDRDRCCGDESTVGVSTVLKGMQVGGWGFLDVLFPAREVS